MRHSTEIRLEQLLGRQLFGANNQPVGRIEEFRARTSSNGCVVVEVIIGMTGLLERLNLGARLVFGAKPKAARIALLDQIDLSNTAKPRVIVDVESLRKV